MQSSLHALTRAKVLENVKNLDFKKQDFNQWALYIKLQASQTLENTVSPVFI
jgi:hypothetical protein